MITELPLLLQSLISAVDKGKLRLSWEIWIDTILIIYRHWVLEAAIAWKAYGTHVTGYDIVDISRSLLPWAAEQGVRDNIQFVRGNLYVHNSKLLTYSLMVLQPQTTTSV
jgi:hypothetical protein